MHAHKTGLLIAYVSKQSYFLIRLYTILPSHNYSLTRMSNQVFLCAYVQLLIISHIFAVALVSGTYTVSITVGANAQPVLGSPFTLQVCVCSYLVCVRMCVCMCMLAIYMLTTELLMLLNVYVYKCHKFIIFSRLFIYAGVGECPVAK